LRPADTPGKTNQASGKRKNRQKPRVHPSPAHTTAGTRVQHSETGDEQHCVACVFAQTGLGGRAVTASVED
jgi:hypothetical protein